MCAKGEGPIKSLGAFMFMSAPYLTCRFLSPIEWIQT